MKRRIEPARRPHRLLRAVCLAQNPVHLVNAVFILSGPAFRPHGPPVIEMRFQTVNAG